MATIYEVSELAGVSLATVSRVMNGNVKVSDKTRKKVVEAMEELGYRPNSIAQSLASSRTNSIGLLVSELHGSFFGEMMSAVEAKLRSAGKHVIITPGHADVEKEKDGIEFLISRNCDALILHVEAVSDDYLRELAQGKIPIVLLNRTVEGIEDNCITLNNELGGYISTKAAIDMGHTKIACIAGPVAKEDSCQRIEGFKRALRTHGLPFDEELFYQGDYRESSGAEGLRVLLETGKPFSVLICCNDEMASGAMTYAREHGLHIPDDLSVIGFDNVIFAKHIYPKLTTINNPVYDMGIMSARWVLKHVYGQSNIDLQHIFMPQLVQRDSVKEL